MEFSQVEELQTEIADLQAKLQKAEEKADTYSKEWEQARKRASELAEKLEKAESESASYRVALESAKDWANRINGDERVCGWVHKEDYGLYCLLAECPVDFDKALTHPSPILDTLREVKVLLEFYRPIIKGEDTDSPGKVVVIAKWDDVLAKIKEVLTRPKVTTYR